MRYMRPAALFICLSFISACAMFEARQPPPPPQPPKELSVPVGKNWKVTEEAPVLTNERNELPVFQKEQSILPEGVQRPTAPAEKERKIETPY